VLVRWRVASPADAGHFLLLARLAEQLAALRAVRSAVPRVPLAPWRLTCMHGSAGCAALPAHQVQERRALARRPKNSSRCTRPCKPHGRFGLLRCTAHAESEFKLMLMQRLACVMHIAGPGQQLMRSARQATQGDAGAGPADAAGVADALRLLARLAAAEPALALQLAQVQVPWPAGGGGASDDDDDDMGDPDAEGMGGKDEAGAGAGPGGRRADLVTLVAAAASVLPRLPAPAVDALGEPWRPVMPPSSMPVALHASTPGAAGRAGGPLSSAYRQHRPPMLGGRPLVISPQAQQSAAASRSCPACSPSTAPGIGTAVGTCLIGGRALAT